MVSLAWPWVLLALPLPIIVRMLLPASRSLAEAGLRVPTLRGFETLKDRSDAEQLLNWQKSARLGRLAGRRRVEPHHLNMIGKN